MNSMLAKIVLPVVLLQPFLSAGGAQDPSEEYTWDCPGSGRLTFRRELLVSTEELAGMIDSSEVTVVHVGFDAGAAGKPRRAIYSEGHVPGARHWTWPELLAFAGDEGRPALARLGLVPGRRVVLYDTGLGMEAAAAFAALDSLGLAGNAALLDGQWVKWVSEGRPTCRWAEQAEPADPETTLSDVMVPAAGLDALLLDAGRPNPAVTLLDARHAPDARSRKPFVRMSWTENLASLYVPVFRGEKDLRRLWARVPACDGHQVVVAARQWSEAAAVYFAARLLGYPVRLLDGSMESVGASRRTLERGT
jgi:3-mercaptopyruvate sulfurtransferase SseA